MATLLIARDPTQPLFVVRKAPLINLASIYGWSSPAALNEKFITFANTLPTNLEIQDSFFERGMLEFSGPGSYRIQNSAFNPAGKSRSAIVIDHPAADVFVFGGDISNGGWSLAVHQFAQRWQKRGVVNVHDDTR